MPARLTQIDQWAARFAAVFQVRSAAVYPPFESIGTPLLQYRTAAIPVHKFVLTAHQGSEAKSGLRLAGQAEIQEIEQVIVLRTDAAMRTILAES
jgi:hypothetical protein